MGLYVWLAASPVRVGALRLTARGARTGNKSVTRLRDWTSRPDYRGDVRMAGRLVAEGISLASFAQGD